MGFFDELKNKDKTEKIARDRQNIKDTIEEKLHGIGFSDKEILEVIKIIDEAEAKIEVLKVSLNGTNINPEGDPMFPLNMSLLEIKKLQNEMAINVRNKIDEIKKRKGI